MGLKRILLTVTLFALAVTVLPGCVSFTGGILPTKPNYSELDETGVKTLAASIEEAVKTGNREMVIADQAGLVVSTPEIQQAIHTRIARSALVKKLLDSGFAAEQRNGMITILRDRNYKKSTTSQDRDRDALVVMSENANRWTIYEGITKASNLSHKSLGGIQDAFYQARIGLMDAGQKYENQDGAITVK